MIKKSFKFFVSIITVSGMLLSYCPVQAAGAAKPLALAAYITDSDGNHIENLTQMQSDKKYYVNAHILNPNSVDSDVSLYAAYYEGARLKDINLEEGVIKSEDDNIHMSMELDFGDFKFSESSKIKLLVWGENERPLTKSIEYDYVSEDNSIITNKVVYENDFEEGLPTDLTNSYLSLYTDEDGNNWLKFDGSSKAAETTKILVGEKNVALSADFYMNGTTGGGTSAFGIGRYSVNANDSQRFSYYSVITPGGVVKRDLFGYSLSNRLSLADTFDHKVFSETAGVLSADYQTTTPFSMTFAQSNGKIYNYAKNASKGVLWKYSTDVTNDEYLFESQKDQAAGYVFYTHSATAYIDNVVANRIVNAKGLKFNLAQNMVVGQWYDIALSVTGDDNLDYPVDAALAQYSYDGNAMEVANGKIRLLKEGSHRILATYKDPITDADITGDASVGAISSYGGIEITGTSDAYYYGEEITFAVVGSAGGVTGSSVDATVTFDGTQVSGSVISDASAGEHTLRAEYNGLVAEKTIYVSKYTSYKLSRTSAYVGTSYSLKVYGVTADGDEEVTDYELVCEDESVTIDKENGTTTFTKPGTFTFNLTHGKIKCQVSMKANLSSGAQVYENFEDEASKTQYLDYDQADIATLEGNNVMLLSNETTDLFGSSSIGDYQMTGKFKITPQSTADDTYSRGFEVVTRAPLSGVFNPDTSVTSIHYVYNLNEENNGYMRVGAVLGDNDITETGQWHDFEIVMNSYVTTFKVDGCEMITRAGATTNGGFYFVANNCEVAIDDITIRKNPSASGDYAVYAPQRELNAYEKYWMYDIAGLRRGESNSFANISSIIWTAPEGSGINIEDGMISFDEGIADGDYTVTATYSGKDYSVPIKVYTPEMTRAEYVLKTVEERQESLAYRDSEVCDRFGQGFDSPFLSYLSSMYAKMLIYPKLRDYSDALMWYVNQGQYEDTIVGRGTDGGDFVWLQLITIYHELYGTLNASDEAWNRAKDYLTSINYAAEGDSLSENHMLVHYATALLTCQAWPDGNVSGDTAQNTYAKYKKYLRNWCNEVLKYGFGEYNSSHYYQVNAFALEILYTYTKDSEIKAMASDMLNYMYADGLDNNIGANFGGAQLRFYMNEGHITRHEPFKRLFNLGDLLLDYKYLVVNIQRGNSYTSTFRPIELLYKQSQDSTRRYENLETSQVYYLPTTQVVDEKVTRYTHISPDYVLGAKILADDSQTPTSGYLNGHQEMPWSMQFGSDSKKLIFGGNARSGVSITTKDYWQTKRGNDTYKLMQTKNTLVGIYGPDDTSLYVHYRIPKGYFDTIDEESGWIFINDGDVYMAFKPLAEVDGDVYSWSTNTTYSCGLKLSESEIIVADSLYSGFVMEVVDTTEYSGTYEEFKADILANAVIDFKLNETESKITYKGVSSNDSVGIDFINNTRYINGAVYTPDRTLMHSSPYLKAIYDSGVINLTYGDDSYTIKAAE